MSRAGPCRSAPPDWEPHFSDQPWLKRLSANNPLYVKYLLEYYANKEAYGDPKGFTGPKK